MYKRGSYIEKNKMCVKERDKSPHHPLIILDWGYPPLIGKGTASPQYSFRPRDVQVNRFYDYG